MPFFFSVTSPSEVEYAFVVLREPPLLCALGFRRSGAEGLGGGGSLSLVLGTVRGVLMPQHPLRHHAILTCFLLPSPCSNDIPVSYIFDLSQPGGPVGLS